MGLDAGASQATPRTMETPEHLSWGQAKARLTLSLPPSEEPQGLVGNRGPHAAPQGQQLAWAPHPYTSLICTLPSAMSLPDHPPSTGPSTSPEGRFCAGVGTCGCAGVGCAGVWVCRCAGVQVGDVWVCGCGDVQGGTRRWGTCGCGDVQVCGCAGVGASRCAGVRVCGRPGVPASGCGGVRVCECAGVGPCGCVNVRV